MGDSSHNCKDRLERLTALAGELVNGLRTGESDLIDAVFRGDAVDLSNGLSDVPDPDGQPHEVWSKQIISSKLLCWLLTDASVQAQFKLKRRIMLTGAMLCGAMDLEGADVLMSVCFNRCKFRQEINLQNARTRAVIFNGCHVDGIQASGLVADGPVFFRRGFRSSNPVELMGATVHGDLDCHDATFLSPDSNPALNLQRVQVDGAFIASRGFAVDGIMDLTSARVGSLMDDKACWPKTLRLINFRYDELAATSPFSAVDRLDWLTRQPDSQVVNPQPFRHLASVLHKHGHEEDARDVMIAYWRKRLRRERPVFRRQDKWGDWLRSLLGLRTYVWRLVYGFVAGFGFARWRLVLWLLGLAFFGGLVFGVDGRMQEAQVLALRSRSTLASIDLQLIALRDAGPPTIEAESRIAVFQEQRPDHAWVERYPQFNKWVYSVDALVPIVDLQQEMYWTPSDGMVRKLYLPFHIAAGWILTTLFVVTFTGLMRRSSED